jgi:hypothetical protein
VIVRIGLPLDQPAVLAGEKMRAARCILKFTKFKMGNELLFDQGIIIMT